MLDPSRVLRATRDLIKDCQSTAIHYEVSYHPTHNEPITYKYSLFAHTETDCYLGKGKTESEAFAALVIGDTVDSPFDKVKDLTKLTIERESVFDEYRVIASTDRGTVTSAYASTVQEALADAAKQAFNRLYGAY